MTRNDAVFADERDDIGERADGGDFDEVRELLQSAPTRQQQGLHTSGFEYMRLSEQIEGHIGNFHRTIDGFLDGLPLEWLLPALGELNLNPLERPVVDLGL